MEKLMVFHMKKSEMRFEIEKDFDVSDTTANDLQDDIIGPNKIKEYREQATKRVKEDKFRLILAKYIDSIFHDFESFLRTEVDLFEDYFQLVSDEYNSSFIIYELEPGIFIFKDLSKALFNILQPEYEVYNNPVDIESDNITMKTKLVVRPGIVAIRFDEKMFFSTT